MPLFNRFTRISAGWRFAYPAYKTIYLSEGYSTPQARQAPRRRARTAGAVPLLCRVALRLPGLQSHLPIRRLLNTPGPASAAGQGQQARSRLCAGWRFAYPAYNAIYISEGYSTPHARQAQQARSRLCTGWRFAYPAYKVIYLSEGCSTPQTRQAPRRRARTAGAEPLVCRVAATPYPAWSSCDLSLIFSPALLKLPVLAASKSLRRSRKAGQPAWMRAEGRVLHGRCLGPTRSLQG